MGRCIAGVEHNTQSHFSCGQGTMWQRGESNSGGGVASVATGLDTPIPWCALLIGSKACQSTLHVISGSPF